MWKFNEKYSNHRFSSDDLVILVTDDKLKLDFLVNKEECQ